MSNRYEAVLKRHELQTASQTAISDGQSRAQYPSSICRSENAAPAVSQRNEKSQDLVHGIQNLEPGGQLDDTSSDEDSSPHPNIATEDEASNWTQEVHRLQAAANLETAYSSLESIPTTVRHTRMTLNLSTSRLQDRLRKNAQKRSPV